MIRTVLLIAFLGSWGANGADFLDMFGLGRKKDENTNTPNASALAALTQDQMIGGLKEALAKGIEQAIASLGKEDGFLKDLRVKIPVPESLRKVEKSLRWLGQDKLADDFITTMNRAAEQAVPAGGSVLGEAMSQMTIADARAILISTNNAATEYFRRTCQSNLVVRFRPIVSKATETTGVTRAYKQMIGAVNSGAANLGDDLTSRLSSLGSTLGVPQPSQDVTDLDGYVTRKALDGLFFKMGEEEKRIRQNPIARTTDLLQQVFGAIGGGSERK